MRLIQTIEESIYSPQFYARLRGSSLDRNLNYYSGLSFILAIILATFVTPNLFSLVSRDFIDQIAHLYPQGLVISVTDGLVSINQPEPYFISMPFEDERRNLLVIDTKSDFSVSQFESYSARMLLKRDTLYVDDGSRFKSYKISDMLGDVTINAEKIAIWRETAYGWITPMRVVLSLFLIVVYFLGNLVTLLYLLPVAFLIWSIGKLKGVAMDYRYAYTVGIYAMTPVLILWTLARVVHFPMSWIVFTILLLVVVVVNLKPDRQPASHGS